jgi:photosystem II stability/assembly factor-like uncharacterized protein
MLIFLFSENIWVQSDQGLIGHSSITKIVETESANMLVATINGGIFISYDKGSTWSKCDLGEYSNSTIMELFKASNGNLIACEMNGNIIISSDDGFNWEVFSKLENNGTKIIQRSNTLYLSTFSGEIYKSLDFGITWDLVCDFENRLIYDMEVDANDVLYIATNAEGILKSVDEGASWEAMNNGLPSMNCYLLYILEGTELFVGMNDMGGVLKYNYTSENWENVYENNDLHHNVYSMIFFEESLFAATEVGVWICTENGWEKYGFGLPENIKVSRILINKENYLYVACQHGYLYKTLDPIKNDASILSIRLENAEKIYAVWGQPYEYEIVVKNLKNELIEEAEVTVDNQLTGSMETLITDELGECHYSFTVPDGLENDLYQIKFKSSKEDYAPTSEIIVIAEVINDYDGDVQWKQIAFPTNSQIETIFESKNGSIYIGTSSNGIYKSKDRGKSWTQKNNGIMEFNWVSSFAEDENGFIYATTDWDGCVVSTNDGSSWLRVCEDLVERARKVCIDSEGNIFLQSYFNQLFISKDGGDIFEVLIDSSSHQRLGNMELIDDVFFLYIYEDGLYYSEDEGETMNLVSGLNSIVVRSIGKKEEKLYASCGNDGLYFSDDKGKTWMKEFTNPIDLSINKIIYDHKHNEFYGIIPSRGIFKSRNGMEWRDYNDGLSLNERTINDICFFSYGEVFASTTEHTLYKRNLGTISDVDDIPFDISDLLVFPNPVWTDVIVSLPDYIDISTISLELYDQSLRTNYNIQTNLDFHNKAISLNLNGFSSGIYYLIISDKNMKYYSKFIKY